MGGITSAGSLLLILTMTGFGAPPRLSKQVGLLTCAHKRCHQQQSWPLQSAQIQLTWELAYAMGET